MNSSSPQADVFALIVRFLIAQGDKKKIYKATCPTCGEYAEVLETRRRPEKGYTRRRHACLNGHRFTIFEPLEKNNE